MFEASREAANKRKRNANASRRFRDRKKQEVQIIKEQNAELREQIAELQRQNTELQRENAELRGQNPQGRMSLPPIRCYGTDQGPRHHITHGPGHPYGATPSPKLGGLLYEEKRNLLPPRLPAGGLPSPTSFSLHLRPGLLRRGPPPIPPVGPSAQHGHQGPPRRQHPQPPTFT
ncbi:hypothetical protein MAPG_08180 [Magnaporthiopsis poae ATCC 64411]|uniref:BZIP domain-containing protein n=1 Tax=Magnaporthiopsis poae (strain ATCC 64411 / 73-15) TaxID=644358 RepID=A0A0C4E6N6_MAGP6|nr:hypothetical protein MAPG_08180 [Magnaporthiopsis poae ATCC 64411]